MWKNEPNQDVCVRYLRTFSSQIAAFDHFASFFGVPMHYKPRVFPENFACLLFHICNNISTVRSCCLSLEVPFDC